MALKKSLKECPLFPPDSAKSHRKLKDKRTKGSSSAARTIVNCFPSASTSGESTDVSPPHGPVRVPRNSLLRSTLKAQLVTFTLPAVSSNRHSSVTLGFVPSLVSARVHPASPSAPSVWSKLIVFCGTITRYSVYIFINCWFFISKNQMSFWFIFAHSVETNFLCYR